MLKSLYNHIIILASKIFDAYILGRMKLDVIQLERVANLFRAFAEPTRLAIVQELKSGELSVSAMVERLTTSQANISKQLKILHDAGVLVRRKDGAQVLYRIADPMVFDLCRLVCDKLNRDAVKPAKLTF